MYCIFTRSKCRFMDSNLPLNEDKVFEKIALGDEQAFRQFFHAYTAKLHPFLLAILHSETIAEDIIQETFLRVWINRAEVGQMEYPVAWMYRVASNLALSHLRSRAAEMRRLRNAVFLNNKAQDEVIEKISFKEMQLLITKAIEELPPRRQYIYRLSREDGLSYKEIADKLKISPNTVKNQLVSAFKFIKEYLHHASGISVSLLLLLFF